MWTAANFIIEGRMRPQVVHRCARSGVPNLSLTMYPFSIPTGKYVPLQHWTDTYVSLKFPVITTFYHSYS